MPPPKSATPPSGRVATRRPRPISSFQRSLQRFACGQTSPQWKDNAGPRPVGRWSGKINFVRLPTSLSPLAERNFRLLWIGQAVPAIGDSVAPIALAFATLSVSHSAGALGLVLAVSTVARVIALPIGGVWSARLPRQLVMLSSDWVRAAIHAVVAALLIT